MACGAGAAVPAMRAYGDTAYPSRTVHIIVPFTPGGGADTVSRLLAPQLQRLLGQPFVVENRAGAAGRIGTGVVAKSDPDGHTLLVSTESSLVIAPHIGVAIGYDPLTDFAPVSLLTRNTVVLVVHPSVPAKTLQEYMALARAKPGELFYASSGVGGPNHLAGEIFNRMAGLKITHVPYAGTGLALQSVLSNQVGAMWGFTAGLAAHIRQGTLRALAVGSKERSPALPDVPTVAEGGVPGYEAVSWVGMVAPAGTPAPVIDKLWTGVDGSLREPSVRNIIVGGGSEIVCSKPDEFRQVIASDYARYGKLADIFQTSK
ncbi:MAG TPA: tripartite tricarboxylate transporter substrate binding protein [Pseudolabrys sp.]|nr:tripartite tricarboxylate transporter substrate binding protein [Pseudolabrys sp.]